MNDGTADATAEVAILLVVARGTVTSNDGKGTPFTAERRKRPGSRAIEFVEGVQALVVELDEAASVIVIRAALGDDLDLSAGVAPLFGVKGGGSDDDLLNGLLIGSNDRGASVGEAVDAHAVERVRVGSNALTV